MILSVSAGFAASNSAHAQAEITSTSVATWASENNVVSLAPGSSLSISDFKSKVESAFAAGVGGTIAFDDYDANDTPVTSIISSYNESRSTLSITTSGNIGTVNTATNHGTSSGTTVLGFDNDASERTFTFSPPLRVFGLVGVSRGVECTPTVTFTLSDNSSVVLTDTVSEGEDNTLFNYEASGDNKIVSVTVSMPDGFARFDDFAFVTEDPVSGPKPTVIAPAAAPTVAVKKAPVGNPAHNPLIWADVPDIAVIRVGKTYYMSSTTMHMSPGLPIMKSTDLVNWSMASYAYETLADNEALRLENGKNAYSKGSWASSLRYHDGVFYASTFSYTSGRTHIYTTRDPERGPWKETSFEPALHDHSLFFDDDGRVYMVYGGGRITLIELKPDLSGIKPGGVNKVLIENVNTVFGTDLGGLNGEGSQLFKINGRYYLFNIASPGSRWARTVIVHRADTIDGPYEGRIALDDRGIAQGGLVDTPEGKWYAYLFKDNGAVGRIPYLVPVTWKDGWPVLGENGKAPMTLDIPAGGQGVSGVSGIVASDEFDRRPGDPELPLAWQWNHNPEPRYWSLTKRPGYLSFVTSRVVSTLPEATNTLTQRTFGPSSSATTSIDVSGMKDGDYAGIAAFQKRYGFVGVKMSGGARSLVMVSADSDNPEEIASVPLSGKTVHLKVECEFEPAPEVARFSYSLDGKSWTPIGRPSALTYTVPHFMGYRFALFYYSTKTAGGRVDFDYYRVGGKAGG